MDLTLDRHGLTVPKLNNLGGNSVLPQLTSSKMGIEFSVAARGAISRNWYFQGSLHWTF